MKPTDSLPDNQSNSFVSTDEVIEYRKSRLPFPVKPNPVPIPEDGIYWIKEAEQYRNWQLSEWRLIRLGGSDIGWFEVFGDDQQGFWDGEFSCVAVLGPKVERPE